jgi:hypothetical protein
MCRFIIAGLLMAVSAANAQVYQRVDPVTGQRTYTNQPPPGTEVIEDRVLPTPLPKQQGSTQQDAPKRSANPASATPVDFPRVRPAEQKERDEDRRMILTEELRAELDALRLLGNKTSSDPSVRRHQQNIASLQRELENLR